MLAKRLALSLGLLLASSKCVAAETSTPQPSQACEAKASAALQRDISKLAAHQRPDEAWHLVHAFLCAPTSQALQTFATARAKVLTFRIAGPGGVEEKPLINPMAELKKQLPSARAWNPDARWEGKDLVVYYSIDAYCWNFFGIRLVGGKWQLSLLGGGCD